MFVRETEVGIRRVGRFVLRSAVEDERETVAVHHDLRVERSFEKMSDPPGEDMKRKTGLAARCLQS